MECKLNRAGAGFRLAKHLWLFLLLFVFATASATAQEEAAPEWLPGLLEKEQITIVVTDSGLGGLSVLADAAEKFRQYPVFREVELVFVNALFREPEVTTACRHVKKNWPYSAAPCKACRTGTSLT